MRLKLEKVLPAEVCFPRWLFVKAELGMNRLPPCRFKVASPRRIEDHRSGLFTHDPDEFAALVRHVPGHCPLNVAGIRRLAASPQMPCWIRLGT